MVWFGLVGFGAISIPIAIPIPVCSPLLLGNIMRVKLNEARGWLVKLGTFSS